jgi:hypothetical protein
MHGGRIKAQSDGLGTGSTFSVWLPCATSIQIPASIIAETHTDAQRRLMPSACR